MLPAYNQLPGHREQNAVIDSTFFDKIRSKFFPMRSVVLNDLIAHHYTLWTQQQTYYQDLINWYEGGPLDEQYQDPVTKQMIDKYPLHINPIKNTCEKHAAILLGATLDDIRFGGVPIQFIVEGDKAKEDGKTKPNPDEDKTKGRSDQQNRIENCLVDVFKNSGGGATFVTQSIRSQYLGGTVWVVHWKPDLPNKISVDTPPVTEFLGFPEGPNMDTLREAWIIREITALEAQGYGFPMPTPMEIQYFYIEYWNKESYSIRINDWVIERPVMDEVGNPTGETERFEGDNPWGIVPVVYIPHIRSSGFLGTSIINKTVKGVVKEMNLREADLGDAVNEDSHTYVAVKNVRGGVNTVSLPDGRQVLDLGVNTGMGAGDRDPDIKSVSTKTTSEPMLKVSARLEKIYRRETNHPAVADGEDEGSQRSSLTLTTRMWPIISHVKNERMYWTTGFLQLIKIILTMASIRGEYDITEEDVKAAVTIKWSQMLPRDRESLVDEIIQRKAQDLGSLEHLLELLGDVYDIDAEVAKIKQDKEEEAEAQLNRDIKKANTIPLKEGVKPAKVEAKDPGGPKGELGKSAKATSE